MTWQRWAKLIVVPVVGLVGCGGGDTLPPAPTTIDYFIVTPNPVSIGGSLTVSWRSVNVGHFEGTPYCTLQRSLQSSTPDAAVQVDCDDTITVTAPSQATSMTYRLSALKRDGATYVTRDVTVTVSGPAPGTVLWTRQFGTSEFDVGGRMAVDADGSVLVTGSTSGSMVGSNAGGRDAFVRKYDADGTVQWTRQFGTAGEDGVAGVAVDSTGNGYVAGWTSGDLGGSNAGLLDAFVRKFDADGGVLWTQQFGTGDDDQGIAIAVDAAGRVIVAGLTSGSLAGVNAGDLDVFVRKYDASGGVLWTQQFGTGSYDYAFSVAVDGSGNVLVGGYTGGSLAATNAGNSDAFVRKLDGAGNELWTRQFGTPGIEEAYGVAVDTVGHVYVVGGTAGDLEGSLSGAGDAFVRKYDGNGNELWTRQFGTGGGEIARDVAVDAAGRVAVAGLTGGSLGAGNAGSADAFVRRFDTEGNEIWTRQFGTSEFDEAAGVVADTADNVLVAGMTGGGLAGPNLGGQDVFLRKYSP